MMMMMNTLQQKFKNTNILTLLRVKASWFIKNIIARKLKYYDHIKRHNCLERNIVEGMVPGRRGRGVQEEGGFKTSGRN
jgi:prophage antirepressor-like protein